MPLPYPHSDLRPAIGRTHSETASARVKAWLWPALLVAASAVGSLVLACVMPFAAVAVVAVGTLPVRSSLLTVAAVWLANQALGYGVLGYPWTADSALWGLAIG